MKLILRTIKIDGDDCVSLMPAGDVLSVGFEGNQLTVSFASTSDGAMRLRRVRAVPDYASFDLLANERIVGVANRPGRRVVVLVSPIAKARAVHSDEPTDDIGTNASQHGNTDAFIRKHRKAGLFRFLAGLFRLCGVKGCWNRRGEAAYDSWSMGCAPLCDRCAENYLDRRPG